MSASASMTTTGSFGFFRFSCCMRTSALPVNSRNVTKNVFARMKSPMAVRASSIVPNCAIFTPFLPNARRAATRISGLRSKRTTLR